MRLRLIREPEPTYTPGHLYLNGKWQCMTLEDVDRRLEEGGVKVPHETAIPLGIYPVTIDFSQRFQRDMLHILDVPQFSGIRIHAGNHTSDTEGCVLVGEAMEGDTLVRSRLALDPLFEAVRDALYLGEQVSISIERR